MEEFGVRSDHVEAMNDSHLFLLQYNLLLIQWLVQFHYGILPFFYSLPMVLYQLTPIWIWLLLQLHCCMNPTSMTAQSSKAFRLWAIRTTFFHFIWALGPLILKPHRSNSFHTILLHGLIPYLQCKTKNKEVFKNHFSKIK